jgi:hypothetical protein
MTRNIELEIKSWSSPDVDFESWMPEDTNVYFLLEIEIGVRGGSPRDIFQLIVATPEGLRARARGPVISERGALILSEYSGAIVRRSIQSIVERCASETWVESVTKLERYFEWEYEDYVVDSD